MRLCEVEGCLNVHRAKGLCSSHYAQLWYEERGVRGGKRIPLEAEGESDAAPAWMITTLGVVAGLGFGREQSPSATKCVFSRHHRPRSALAGLVGQVYGQTTPSITKVEVLGELREDYAVNVYFKDRGQSFSTTAESYATQDAIDAAKQRRTMKVLSGGKR
jgi:hypothetical protein